MPGEMPLGFGIIVGALTVASGLVYGVNYLQYGFKPKPVHQDVFDRAMVARDAELLKKAKAMQ
eukprot:CAMPEP_0118927242 /NCGR_PEP_ID=MMETSP1169-20130426/4752_1 /TAXON_ID=36882 /ORGANISM="Pyramimonas obovata, Strain CCMP722" /LENGTH=62 /DNA_ID=CAMNT_0006868973 /DNA_START=64 /DNA_END=252 /DNA_ORIENTATION=-